VSESLNVMKGNSNPYNCNVYLHRSQDLKTNYCDYFNVTLTNVNNDTADGNVQVKLSSKFSI
jgi:hypothetical protein